MQKVSAYLHAVGSINFRISCEEAWLSGRTSTWHETTQVQTPESLVKESGGSRGERLLSETLESHS